MRSFLLLELLAFAAAQQSGVHLTVLPSEPPTVTTRDRNECGYEDIPSYFMPPQPTGRLSSALLDHWYRIDTCPYYGAEATNCPFPDKSFWCGMSTAGPSSVLDEYIAYGSTASSWWAARSSAAVSLAINCPNRWWTAIEHLTFGALYLNLTIIEAECYAEADPTPSEPMPATRSAPTTAGPIQTEAPDEANAAFKRTETTTLLLAVGIGLAGSAVNWLL